MELSEKEFFSITPRSFANKLAGYRRKEERISRESWEQTRAIAVTIMRPNLAPAYKKKSVSELWPFAWDNIKKEVDDPEEAFKRSKALWEEIDRKRAEAKKKNID